MARNDGWASAVLSVGMRLLCLLLLGGSSCSSDSNGGAGPLVRLHLAPVDSTAAQAILNVTARDPGGQDKKFTMTFDSAPFDLLGASFPAGTRGPTSYQVNLYGAASCLVSSGSATLNLDSDGVFELSIVMTAVPLCGNGALLTVQVANVLGGAGTVTSTPAGINCQGGATGCSAAFMKGTQVTLTTQAPAGTFAGWSGGGCSGLAGCTLTLSQDVQVQAVFTACHGWCTEPLPFPVSANLNGVAGTGASNVLVVGDSGTAALFDGTAWQKLTPPSGSLALRAVAGRAGGSVLSVAGDSGTILQLGNQGWTSISNSSTTNMNLRALAIGDGNTPNTLVVGDGGTALVLPAAGPPLVNHTLMSRTLANLYAIAQNPNATKDDLLIGGAVVLGQGVAESWDGNNTFNAQMTTGGANIAGNIYALLCGTSTFYGAGDMGAIVSRTSGGGAGGGANKWVNVTSPVNTTLRAMWATADNNIYAVGDGGTIIRYDGVSWAKVAITPPPTATLRAIWGSSATNIYVVGDSGLVLHYLP